MNLGLDALPFQKIGQGIGVRRGDLLPLEIGQTLVGDIPGNGHRHPAAGKAEREHPPVARTFFDLGILPQDSDVRHPVAHVLRNIGIAQVQHFQREVRRLGHQLVRTVVDRDTALFEQVQGVFVQTSRLLDSDLQISHFAFVYKISPVFPRAADYEKTRHGNRRVVGYLSYSDTA